MKKCLFLAIVVICLFGTVCGLTQAEQLLKAAAAGKLNEVSELLRQGADINAVDSDGDTPLHLALRSRNKEVAELLVANGAEVNAKDKNGTTLLHCAAWGGHKGVAKLLIKKGADISAKDNDGNIPLHYAARQGKKGVAELLIETARSKKKVEVNAKNNEGNTPLALCCPGRARRVCRTSY